MKLLDKQTIVTLKGNERKQEIDEGVKLARKIDTLRQTSAKEEANLSKFRTESLAKTKAEIDFSISTRDSLLGEVTRLENRKKEALIPLDNKWKEVNLLKESLLNEEVILKNKDDLLFNLTIELEKQRVELHTEKERIDDIKKLEVQKLDEINKHNHEVENLLLDTESQTQIILTSFSKREDELIEREKEVEYRAIDNQNYRQLLQNKEDEINIEKRMLADQRKTLERAFARLKNK